MPSGPQTLRVSPETAEVITGDEFMSLLAAAFMAGDSSALIASRAASFVVQWLRLHLVVEDPAAPGAQARSG